MPQDSFQLSCRVMPLVFSGMTRVIALYLSAHTAENISVLAGFAKVGSRKAGARLENFRERRNQAFAGRKRTRPFEVIWSSEKAHMVDA